MKHIKNYFFILLLCTPLAHSEETKDFDARTLHRNIWSFYQLSGGNYEQAGKWYDTLLSDPNIPAASYKGALKFLYETGQFSEIVRRMPELEKEFKDDPAMQLLFAQVLEKTGKKEEAYERIIKLNTKFKSNQEIALYAANVYTGRQELENALIVIDKFLNSSPRKPNNFIFHFLKAQIYTNMNKKNEALASVKECLEIQPGFDRGWLLRALLEEQLNNLDDAIKGYTNFLELTGDNQEIEQHLLVLMFKSKVADEGSNTITMNKACYFKALVLFERKLYQQALQQIDACLQEKQSDKEEQLLKIQILTSMKKFDAANKQLLTWIRKTPNETLWYKTLHLLCRIGLPYQTAITTLEEITREQHNIILPHLYLADLYTRANNPQKALKHHKKALTLTNDAMTKTKLLFHMGLLNYELRNFDVAKSLLEKGYQLQTNFPPLLNLLAYYYASKGNNISKAQQLAQQALNKDKDNPHFLDTHAYILYKQKNYDKALNVFRTLHAKMPNDFTVLKHLGKTLYEKGNIAEAQANIERALTLARNDNDTIACTTLLKRWSFPTDEKKVTQ